MSVDIDISFLMVFDNDLFVFILFKISSLVLCSYYDIRNILLYNRISKASSLSRVTLVSVGYSHRTLPWSLGHAILSKSHDLFNRGTWMRVWFNHGTWVKFGHTTRGTENKREAHVHT